METIANGDKTWVYGVIPADATLTELERRRDRIPQDVRVQKIDDLALIVGDAPPPDPRATRDQALAHARVLEAAAADAPVVPFRFGTMVTSGAEASELLGPWHDRLSELLERTRGRVQLTLKAEYLSDAVLREIMADNPEIRALREQTQGLDEMAARDLRVRLGELVSIALEALRQRDAAAIVERLGAIADAYTIGPLESEFMVVNAPFLVERDRMPQFEEAAAALAEEQAQRMHMTLLGPMPAYDFIEGQQPWA